MNTTERELLQECHQLIDKNLTFINGTDNLLQKIEACLAKPVQEPVAFAIFTPEMNVRYFSTDKPSAEANASAIDAVLTPLYTSPQAQEPLSDDACVKIQIADDGVWAHFRVGKGYAYSQNLSASRMSSRFAEEYIEAKLNEKNLCPS